MTYKTTFISLTLLTAALLATGTTFLLFNAPVTVSAAQEQPDAYMENVVALMLDKQGKPKMKIVTPKMVHYKKNDATQLEAPSLTIYRQSPQPWYVTAHYAKAMHGIDHVDFWEEVTIHHSGDQRSPATLIATQKLTVYPAEQRAETTEDVTFTQPSIIVKGTGMRADMNTGEIHVLSQARGEYVPSS